MRHARYSERRLRTTRATGRFGWARTLVLRGAVLAALFLPALAVSLTAGRAQNVNFLRIGTGSTAGTYFPVGGLIASAVSNPAGSRDCDRGGSCGVPGMIAAAVSTHGSVANVDAIGSGEMESGLSQADIAYWAYTGTGIYADKGAVSDLRTIANLFPETVHIVVRRDLYVQDLGDLRGKRISVDRLGSGTRVDALMILEAFGLTPDNVELVSVGAGEAADMLREGALDGFFFVAGTPANAVADLADQSLINLVPIAGDPADRLTERIPFFARMEVPSGTYFNVAHTNTLSVGAQWLVSAKLPDQLVYEITRALWHENTRALLDGGHPKARLIRLETALNGLGAPLHAGAERYYREIGLIEGEGPGPKAEAPQ